MSIFALSAVQATFQAFGERAMYEDIAGGIVNENVLVIPRRPDDIMDVLGSQVHNSTALFEVQSSVLPSPVKGGVITFPYPAGQRYVVKAPPIAKDPRRLVWVLDTYPEDI